jgi:Protein of unknown function (DUF3551)
MRLSLISAVVALFAVATTGQPASAQPIVVHYCANYTTGAINCGFFSDEQCAAAVSGVGGFCQMSPYDEYELNVRARSRRFGRASRR